MALNDLGNRLRDPDATRQAAQIFERLAEKDAATSNRSSPSH
jgi:hypothetical protein